MRSSRRRTVLVVLAAAAAIFVAAGGPATAGKLVTKNQIAPSAVTNKAIANGAITDAKLSKALRAKLKKTGASGTAGAPGAAGAAGAKGDTGARGPAGAFNVLDATGKVLGTLVGAAPGGPPFVSFYTADGAILTYDAMTGPAYPTVVHSGPLFYKQAACAGQAYATLSGYLIQQSIVLDGPPSAGSKIYVMQPASSPESFTYQAVRSPSGCSTTSGSISNAYPAREAGVVPSVVKPFTIAPAG